MNLILIKTLYLKSFVLLFPLFFSFNLQAKIAMPVEAKGGDVQEARLSSNFWDAKTVLWKNTSGTIREITKKEREGDVDSVGKIRCQKGGGYVTSTAIMVGYEKGGTYLLLAGHAVCDANKLLRPNKCVFLKKYWGSKYPEGYGYEFEYPVTNIVRDGACNAKPNTDLAMVFLKYEVPGKITPVVLSNEEDGLNLTRVKKNNVSYLNNKTNKTGKMFVVGQDAVHNKLMLSENCGTFKKSSRQFNADVAKELAHDCKITPGYSGGPVFYKEKGVEAKLVCIVTRSVAIRNTKSNNYRRFNIEVSGGACLRLDNSNYTTLRRRLNNL